MTLQAIAKVLSDHGINFKESKNYIVAKDVATYNGRVIIEEVIFNEDTTYSDLKNWLGY